jgi:predicted nucleic acid-binding protein
MAAEDRTFVDTNILVYAHDSSETAKQPIARSRLDALWAEHAGTLSTQVLQEFYCVATRKMSPPLARAEAREIVGAYAAWPVVLLDPAVILAATDLEEKHGLSFWEALVVQAATVGGAGRLLTEDLQDGMVIEGVRIENPFAVGQAVPE